MRLRMGGVEGQRGQSLAEIGVLIVLVVLVALVGVTVFSNALSGLWTNTVTQVVVAI